MKFNARRLGLSLAAPLLAVLVALLITSAVLAAAGDPVADVWRQLLTPPNPRVTVNIINEAIVLYLSAMAVAIGFRMNLFNIGVEGQYRVAVFAAAAVCGQGFIDGPLNVVLGLVVAMLAGGLWAGIAGWLKVRRGVSEVISTIMLNAIATGIIAYLLTVVAPGNTGDVTKTREIPESSWLTGFALIPGARNRVYTLVFLSVAVGLLYWFVLNRTRFGYDLRAAGRSESAAIASGVDAKRMVLTTMVLSGAVAGLVGMPLLFGQDHAYGGTFQAGLGFAGIGIALLGRNHPLGVALGALLWGYLNQQSAGLQNVNVSPELVAIIQGVIVLAVVIAYEIVRRLGVRMEQATVATRLAAGHRAGDTAAPVSVLSDGSTATSSGGSTATSSGGSTATSSGGSTATSSGGSTATTPRADDQGGRS